MDFFSPSTSTPSSSRPTPTRHEDNQAHTLATQDGSLCTEQDLSSQRFSCMSMPDTQDHHMSPLSPASDCSSKIDNMHSKMENLVHEINESRTSELKMMDSYKDMIVVKVTDMCQEMTERMYAVYEANSHDMAVKLQELSEVLESCSKLNEELQEACQALASLRKGLDMVQTTKQPEQ